jgi:hypothetical protein
MMRNSKPTVEKVGMLSKITSVRRFLCYMPIVGMAFLIACASSLEDRRSLDFVPLSSTMCAHINWHSLETQPSMRQLIDVSAIERCAEQMGITANALEDVSVFIAPNSEGKAATAGIIVNGSFDVPALVALWQRDGWTEQQNAAMAYYKHAGSAILLVPLTEHTVAMADEESVVMIQHVTNGSEKNLSEDVEMGSVVRQVSDSSVPLGLCIKFTQLAIDTQGAAIAWAKIASKAFDCAPVGSILQKVGVAKGFACSMAEENNAVRIQGFALMATEESASFLVGSLNMVGGLARMAQQFGAQSSDAHPSSDLSTSRQGCMVYLSMLVDKELLLKQRQQS